jgi:hypothetical protein
MNLEKCNLVELPRCSDLRGSLTFIESGVHIPFSFERVYYLYDIPKGADRGAHGHRALHQLIIAISGRFDVELDDGTAKKRFSLSRPDQALYVCPMIWRDLENFSADAVCMVIASAKYDESDYFRVYEEFLEAVKNR